MLETKNDFLSVLNNIKQLIQPEINQFQELLNKKIEDDNIFISSISCNILHSGGKHLRSSLTLLSSRMLNCYSQDILLLALAVELIHAATLLHDDVVDDAKIRHHLQTSNMLWGNKSCILVGDFLFTQAFQAMVETKNLNVLASLSKVSSIIAKGELMQLENIGNVHLTQHQYYDIIGAKTSALFAAATEVSAIIANYDNKIINAMYDYGYNLGLVFQIVDDCFDYYSISQDIGKQLGTDFKEQKLTLPIIMLLSQVNITEKQLIIDYFTADINQYTEEFINDKFNQVLLYLKRYNIKEQVLSVANTYIDKGLHTLATLKDALNFKEHQLTYYDSLVQLLQSSLTRTS